MAACSEGPVEPTKPVVVQGYVQSTAGDPIANAVVTVQDVNDEAVSGSVTTDAAGAYRLDVSRGRGRSVRLHVAAPGFQTFPSGIRRSPPLDLSQAVGTRRALVVQGPATRVSLEPVANPTGLGSLSGVVRGGAGALVVAEGAVAGSAICAADDSYVIFNLTPGIYHVRAYAAGRQFARATATVDADQRTTGVDLAGSNAPCGSISGNVSIEGASAGYRTSVVLAVASTYNAALQRGEVPPGLRIPSTGAPNITGAFTISGVPDGSYKVLTAFENDGLVRDPDPALAATQVFEVTVTGDAIQIPTTFQITRCLAVVSPGGLDQPDVVEGTPTFTWADDAAEDFYSLEVLDNLGTIVWSADALPGVSDSPMVSIVYGGAPLLSGRTYQFRATAWEGSPGTAQPISRTEELKGVFVAQ